MENHDTRPTAGIIGPNSAGKDVYALRGRVVLPNTILMDGAVIIAGDAIAWIGPATEAAQAGFGPEVIDAVAPQDDRFILPGLVDINVRGGGGVTFSTAHSHDQIMEAINEHRRWGTTSLVASLMCANPMVLRERAEKLADMCEKDELAGIHFEGPFLSNKHCGVHDASHIYSANPALARELMVASRGHCVSMTFAPEKSYTMGPSGVAETLIDMRVVPAFGFTDASAKQMRKALREIREKLSVAPNPRCTHVTVTNMYNNMRPADHINPGPIFELLSDAAGGGIICQIVADKLHIASETLLTTYELIGREQIALTTACVSAGAADGDYALGATPIVIRDGIAYAKEPSGPYGSRAHVPTTRPFTSMVRPFGAAAGAAGAPGSGAGVAGAGVSGSGTMEAGRAGAGGAGAGVASPSTPNNVVPNVPGTGRAVAGANVGAAAVHAGAGAQGQGAAGLAGGGAGPAGAGPAGHAGAGHAGGAPGAGTPPTLTDSAPHGRVAGGALHLIELVQNAYEAGMSLVDAVYCASAVPAKLLGDQTIGTIAVGNKADLLITSATLQPLGVIRGGKPVV